MDRKLEEAKKIAKKQKIKKWDTLSISEAKNKRFSIISPSGKKINFGLFPFKGDGAFLDHKDEMKRKAWQARHIKIMKDGQPAYLNPESAEYYSWNILW
jgi:hypothetical protein